VRPCLRELSRDRAFPAWLLGPVLFVELYLFALSLFVRCHVEIPIFHMSSVLFFHLQCCGASLRASGASTSSLQLLVARWLQSPSALADTQPAGELPDAWVFSAWR
jgi:hypothetical protein